MGRGKKTSGNIIPNVAEKSSATRSTFCRCAGFAGGFPTAANSFQSADLDRPTRSARTAPRIFVVALRAAESIPDRLAQTRENGPIAIHAVAVGSGSLVERTGLRAPFRQIDVADTETVALVRRRAVCPKRVPANKTSGTAAFPIIVVNQPMNLRAVICDIYHTLLAVKPPAADAETRWLAFWDSIPGMKRRMSMEKFSAATKAIIDREHAVARANGVAHPEILWSRVLKEAVPELAHLPPAICDELLWQQAQFLHTVQLMPGAAEALRKLQAKGIVLGLASNSQPYTLRELDAALASAGLSRQLFDPALCFFSFEHGFSKPDPAVFRLLSKKLESRGISTEQILMIGNRLDNDVLPAKAQGWQTWHFTEQTSAQTDQQGNWHQFSQWLS